MTAVGTTTGSGGGTMVMTEAFGGATITEDSVLLNPVIISYARFMKTYRCSIMGRFCT